MIPNQRLLRFRSLVIPPTLLCAALLIAAPLTAGSGSDLYGYTWVDSNEPGGPVYTDYSFDNGGRPEGSDSPGGADWIRDFTLPFPFVYYGRRFTQFRATDNGFVTFDLTSGVEATNKPVPLNQSPDTVLAFLWDDLLTNAVQWGAIQGGTGYRVSFAGQIQDRTSPITYIADIILWSDGSITFQYYAAGDNGSITVGIESPGATYGIQNLYNGAGPSAGFLKPGYAIRYTPPPTPNCSVPAVVQCGANPSATPAVEPVPSAAFYSCSPTNMNAYEKVFTFTLAESTAVTASLTNLGGRDLRIFQLDGCDAFSCLNGDSANVDLGILAPGTYTLVVDGPTTADNGTFTLNLDCMTVSTPVQCGDTVPGDTRGRTQALNGYACAPAGTGGNYGGHEQIFTVDLPTPQHLFATLSNNPDLDVFLFPPGSLDPADCLDFGDVTVDGFNLPAGTYTIVVDGPPGSEGTFDLDVVCGTQMDCATPQPTTLTCGSTITGAVLAPNPSSAFRYNCDDSSWLGPEHVYVLDIANPTGVIINLDSPDGLGLFLLNGCDEGECLGGNQVAACTENLEAGRYLLVVDSPTDSGGTYDLQVNCIPAGQFSRWSQCEDPSSPRASGPGCEPGATQLADTQRRRWSFGDQWYCVDDPQHRNNDGTGYNGCTFAMYAVVECGTEMHLPLYDVESGHIRVFDILNNRYVNLTSQTSTGWFAQGTDISWRDRGCPPGTNPGADPRFENVVNDIHFYNDDDPGTAPVCGVFRMEFYEWAGFEWELFANCSGANDCLFEIYDNVCDALDAYSPRPELSIVDPQDDGNCPNPTVTFDVTNSGCAPAENFVVRIIEELSDGTDEIKKELIVPSVGPGETWTPPPQLINLSSSASPFLRIEVDANDDVYECSEASATGSATACRPQQGEHTFRFAVCDDCVTLPRASATPARVCVGDPTTLSGSGSSIPTCAAGVPLEYNWTQDPTPPAANDPNWTTDPTLAVPSVDQDTTWYVWIRCQNDPTCTNQDPQAVEVTTHQPPVMGEVSVSDLDICENGLEISWTPAQFFHDPVLGPGLYHVYRTVSTGDLAADCAALEADIAAGTANLVSTVTGTFVRDFTTAPNETYVYAVQAEDLEPVNPCPAGPQGGAVDTACALAATWDEVDRTKPTNDVGNTLRASDGDQDSVSFYWQDPRAAGETRERFRVTRSELAVGPFKVIGNLLDVLTFDDLAAPSILYFYDVRTMDTCGNVADDPYPPDRPPPASCQNLELACGEVVEGTTLTCTSDFASHDCFPQDSLGPDRLHSIRLANTTPEVRFRVDSRSADLDVYVYDSSLSTCLTWGDDEAVLFNAGPGRYWVVVDGADGQAGDYTLTVECP